LKGTPDFGRGLISNLDTKLEQRSLNPILDTMQTSGGFQELFMMPGIISRLKQTEQRVGVYSTIGAFQLRAHILKALNNSQLELHVKEEIGTIAHTVIRILVAVRRPTAAWKFFVSLKELGVYTDSSNTTITALNLLLSRAEKHSRGKHNTRALSNRPVKDFIYRLQKLMQLYQLQPDRQTLLLLLKYILANDSCSPIYFRRLFDSLVKAGYPMGMNDSLYKKHLATVNQSGAELTFLVSTDGNDPHRTIFGTRAATLSLPSTNGSAVCLAGHVIPLYELFMKAFDRRGDILAGRFVAVILNDLKEMIQQSKEEKRYTEEDRKL